MAVYFTFPRPQADPLVLQARVWSKLSMAIDREQDQEALALVQSGQKFPLLEHGYNNLTSAINGGLSKELIRELISQADEATINFVDISGANPLMAAARKGYEDIVELLLEKGADPNIPDKTFYCALSYAVGCSPKLPVYGMDRKSAEKEVGKRMRKIAQLLILRGAHLESQKEGILSPLTCHLEGKQIYPRVVAYLISKGAQVHPTTQPDTSELIHKIERSKASLAKLYLKEFIPNNYRLVLEYI